MQLFLAHQFYAVIFSPAVHMHTGLLCIAFCVPVTQPQFRQNHISATIWLTDSRRHIIPTRPLTQIMNSTLDRWAHFNVSCIFNIQGSGLVALSYESAIFGRGAGGDTLFHKFNPFHEGLASVMNDHFRRWNICITPLLHVYPCSSRLEYHRDICRSGFTRKSLIISIQEP